MFDLTKINNIPFKFAADFKLLIIINGQQTASATFSCPYCFVTLGHLRSFQNPTNEMIELAKLIKDDLDVENPIRLKTYGDLRRDYEKFCLSGKNKKEGKNFHSTINPPLFNENDDIKVLQKCVIPELHVLQGLVNHLFWHGLIPLLGEEKAMLWPKKLNVVAQNYHGYAFEGNACRKLLKEADKLNDPKIYVDVGYFSVIPYIHAYKAMNKLVDCCFTSGKRGMLINSHINELRNALKSIGDISETLKIHVILEHVESCLQFIDNNNGLGFWSEQSGEAVHHEFLKFWSRYKLNCIEDINYAPRLQKAVVEFSSLHI